MIGIITFIGLTAEAWAAIAHWLMAITAIVGVGFHLRKETTNRRKIRYMLEQEILRRQTPYFQFHWKLFMGMETKKILNKDLDFYCELLEKTISESIPYDTDQLPHLYQLKEKLKEMRLTTNLDQRKLLCSSVLKMLETFLKE